MHEKRWHVEVLIDEDDGRTRATARLHTADDTRISGTGIARLRPADRDVPEIGDELAASRALSDLAHNLLECAAGDIEELTHKPVRLDR
jgi:predicted transcriptional regulator